MYYFPVGNDGQTSMKQAGTSLRCAKNRLDHVQYYHSSCQHEQRQGVVLFKLPMLP